MTRPPPAAIVDHINANWGFRQICDKCKRPFRAVRAQQIICNCCAPVLANRPMVLRVVDGGDDGADQV